MTTSNTELSLERLDSVVGGSLASQIAAINAAKATAHAKYDAAQSAAWGQMTTAARSAAFSALRMFRGIRW